VEAINRHDTRYDIFTSSFSGVEIADDQQRAILLLPLMHVGANKKGLYWTAKMLKKIGNLFRSVPFRYDLDGQEGSSHTINKLSSPHFDVGWTYSSEEGSWYDPKTKILWTKGEITHPEVIKKLGRTTSDGKREVNYGSMGVIVEKAICSICGAEMNGNTCEEGHTRLEKYDGKTCYKVPVEVSKALHVALTNDPADGEAEIKNVLIQEMGDSMQEKNFQKKGNQDSDESKSDDYSSGPSEQRDQAGEQMDKSQLNSQIPGGLATSSPQTEQPGMAPSPEVMLKDLAERIKTIEQKISLQAMSEPKPEVVNASPQDQFVQDNMGSTSLDEGQGQTEASNMDVKDGQTSNAKTSVNPEKEKAVMQDTMGGDPMSQIMGMLQQILQRLPGAEMQDMGKEALSAGKGQAKKAQDDLPTEHQVPGDAVGNSEDEGNAKNKANMMKPGSVATADNAEEPEEDEKSDSEVAESGEVDKLKTELADMKSQMKQMRANLELQDSGNVPEFGGSAPNKKSTEIADMGASGRIEAFGEYGAWDSIFNGPSSAERFRRGN